MRTFVISCILAGLSFLGLASGVGGVTEAVHMLRVLAGTGVALFAGSACVGIGLFAGLNLGARWFGAIKVKSTSVVNVCPAQDTAEGR